MPFLIILRPENLRISPCVIAGLLAVGVSGGCVHYHPRPVDPEATAAGFEGRTLDDAGLREFASNTLPMRDRSWPPASWSLTDLTVAAFYYHPALDLARAQWAAARARGITAGERPNPSLNVTPAYNTTRAVPSPWLPLAVLDFPVETAGKRGHREARAAKLSEAARVNVASVAWQVRARLRDSLIALDAATKRRTLLTEQSDLQEQIVALLERQYDVGAISAYELTQARIQADATRFALNDAKRGREEAQVQLAGAIGVPATALDSVAISFDELDRLPEEDSLAIARRQALSNRSDILGSLAEYAAAESALQLEIAKQYPDLHLLPGYEYDQGEDKWSLGFTLTLPLMNRNRGGIAEATAAREEAAARFNLLQSGVLAEIDRAVVGYRAALVTRAEADATLARLRKQENTAGAMLEAGEISRSDLLGVRLQLSEHSMIRLDAQVKAWQALGRLEEALQSPLGLPAAAWQVAPRPGAPEDPAAPGPGNASGRR